MPPIRFVVQANPRDGDDRLEGLARYAAEARREAGCIQVEDFRSVIERQNLLHPELWESEAAWDDHWYRLLEAPERSGGEALLRLIGDADSDLGETEPPSRVFGRNGIELYQQRFYAHSAGTWYPATVPLAESVRWPAWGPVRIIVQGTSDPDSDPTRQLQTAERRRAYPGCEQFEHFRGTEFPENTVLMETWSTPKIFDDFWAYLQTEHITNPVPGEPARPARRRYGIAANEWHQQCEYTIADGVWQPKQPSLRSTVVRW